MKMEQLVGIADEGKHEQEALGCTNNFAVLHQDDGIELALYDVRLRDDQRWKRMLDPDLLVDHFDLVLVVVVEAVRMPTPTLMVVDVAVADRSTAPEDPRDALRMLVCSVMDFFPRCYVVLYMYLIISETASVDP